MQNSSVLFCTNESKSGYRMPVTNRKCTLTLPLLASGQQRTVGVSLSDLPLDNVTSPPAKKTPSMTPTPTQFLFPKSVTAEQEDYASGFARALEEIYRAEGRPGVSNTKSYSSGTHNGSQQQSTAIFPTSVPPSTFSNGIPDITMSSSNSSSQCFTQQSIPLSGGMNTNVWPVSEMKSELVKNCDPMFSSCQPVGVTEMNGSCSIPVSTGNLPYSIPHTTAVSSYHHLQASHQPVLAAADCSTSLQPRPATPMKVDLAEQEQWKLERKRAKNRIAAARCQTRKLERIAQLQDKAHSLRQNNDQLLKVVNSLTNQVGLLKHQIMMHVDRGCRLMSPPFPQ